MDEMKVEGKVFCKKWVYENGKLGFHCLTLVLWDERKIREVEGVITILHVFSRYTERDNYCQYSLTPFSQIIPVS